MQLQFLGIFIHEALTGYVLNSRGFYICRSVLRAASLSKLHNSCSKLGSDDYVTQKR